MVRIENLTIGAPCWTDLSTSEIPGATAYYGSLFGWNARDQGENFGNYHIVDKDGSAVSGMMGKHPEMGNAGIPDAWLTYFGVEDAKATAAKIEAAGGQLITGPHEVGGLGAFGLAMDPSGAAFGFWQSLGFDGFQEMEVPGTPGWFELSTRDFAAAKAFYTEVFGVEIGPMPGFDFDAESDPEGLVYEVILIDGKPKAGLMDAAAFLPEGVPSNWQVVWVTENADATVAKVEELGGQVMRPAEDSPFGRYAVLADPTGAVFQVIDGPEGA